MGAYLLGRGHEHFGKGAQPAHRLLLRRTPEGFATAPGEALTQSPRDTRSGRGPGDIRAGEGKTYRLGRIEQLTGRGLRDSRVRLELELALTIREIVQAEAPG